MPGEYATIVFLLIVGIFVMELLEITGVLPK